ncbi:hypothetical protein NBO_504g0001 [Nosema bombycis CQ1]|uniref:Uncharacterized protein n=1 Tax=Nosema bombycis (strain CQ1 / CVCC 102059) TaxID=578461 RepID=R0KNF0_NOSB1|nr:hypothetical protein NBO_504g0001 [Nosema bombycis CQ1]|eukprot:EOB12201.1 hypothetical protein NBO_504g0001 [Nosema bombycis CQ1]
MKNHSRITYFFIKLSVVIYLVSINFTLCTESFENKSSENSTYQIIEEESMNQIGNTSKNREPIISSSEVEMIVDNPTPGSSNESVKIFKKSRSRPKKEYLEVLFDKQNKFIAKMKNILNKSRNKKEWEDLYEFLAVRSSYIEFISLTTDIKNAMNRSFKKSLDSYNLNLQKTLIEIESILKVQTILMKCHAKKPRSLPVIVSFNESFKKTKKFYEEMYAAFDLKLKKRDEIENSITSLRSSFDSALVFIKNVLKKIKKDNYILTRRKLLTVFFLFDKNHPGSLYRVYKLNKSMVEKSLEDLSSIKNSASKFVQSSNMISTNN